MKLEFFLMNKNLAFLLLIVISLGCKNTKNITSQPTESIFLDTINVSAFPEQTPVQTARDIDFDLIHTSLEVKFDLEKQYLFGKANLTISPYFYPKKTVVLDAKKMEVHNVKATLKNQELKVDSFVKSNLFLTIYLNQEISSKDTIEIEVDYTSKPNEFKPEGIGSAIRSDKGLYFIDPTNLDPKKPTQIWTQGEPEANSNWFPTFDTPNQKTTQEIAITVDEKFTTLSNGILDFSSLNGDGTRTDYWSMNLPHSSYLFMMAIGEFAVVEDNSIDIPVKYFVEPKYKEHAAKIFKYTPDMLQFFSKKLGVDYPWPKFDQVIVRDYVSGAMENTTAVIFGEFIQKTSRELIDGDNQDIVAHEMFHHWFGDLITCEGWGNLTVNESFATYAPYLWREFKYGKTDADRYLENNKQSYFDEAIYKQEKLVRTQFYQPLDMFDRHSYSKGSTIIHMLRNQLGDDAFLKGLQIFLTENAYQPVEAIHLKLAMEKASGKNLDVFFNQWYFSKGHPEVEVDYIVDDASKTVKIQFNQTENTENIYPFFNLPVEIEVQTNKGVYKANVELFNRVDSVKVRYEGELENVVIDPKGKLLVKWQENKPFSWFNYQYYNSTSFSAQKSSFLQIAQSVDTDTAAKNLVIAALSNPYYWFREKALDNLSFVLPYQSEELRNTCVNLVKTDDNSMVRKKALAFLNKNFSDKTLLPLMQEKLSDSSLTVVGEALYGVYKINPDLGLVLASEFEDEESSILKIQIASIYAKSSDTSKVNYFKTLFNSTSGNQKSFVSKSWVNYLKNVNQSNFTVQFLPILEQAVLQEDAWWNRLKLMESLFDLQEFYSQLSTDDPSGINAQVNQEILKCVSRLIEKEKNPQVLQYF